MNITWCANTAVVVAMDGGEHLSSCNEGENFGS